MYVRAVSGVGHDWKRALLGKGRACPHLISACLMLT